jgi:quercetin dioxygenase-like cupin family protein
LHCFGASVDNFKINSGSLLTFAETVQSNKDMHTHFFKDTDSEWEIVETGISRKIVGHDTNIMMVKVAFEKGAIGTLHSHIHSQTTYVAKGIFEVNINGTKQTLEPGDCFFAPSNAEHGVTCLETGELIDVFSPARKDFLK